MRYRLFLIVSTSSALLACGGDTDSNPPILVEDAASHDGAVDSSTVDTGVDSAPASDASTSDADGGTDAVSDAPIEAGPRCDPTKAFGAPVNEGSTINAGGIEDGARLSPSGLELFFTRDEGNNGKRVYRSTRATLSSPWSAPASQGTLSVTPPSVPASMSLTLDSTELFGYIAVYTGTTWRIYATSRSTIGGLWAIPGPVANLAANGTDEQPWLNAAGDRLYFMSNRGSVTFHTWVATKTNGVFGPATLADPFQVSEDRWPVLSDDELTMYYGAYDGTNGVRIYKKTRPAMNQDWKAGAPVAELAGGSGSSAISAPTWLSKDGCDIYFVSNRSGGQGQLDVWHATKPQ